MSEATTAAYSAGWIPGDSWGSRIALVRQTMGWNYSEAAEATGLDRQSWQNWEDGRKPRDEAAVAAKIAAATGCNLVELDIDTPGGLRRYSMTRDTIPTMGFNLTGEINSIYHALPEDDEDEWPELLLKGVRPELEKVLTELRRASS